MNKNYLSYLFSVVVLLASAGSVAPMKKAFLGGSDCPICLVPFVDAAPNTDLYTCGHCVCEKCSDQLFGRRNTADCPMCRAEVKKAWKLPLSLLKQNGGEQTFSGDMDPNRHEEEREELKKRLKLEYKKKFRKKKSEYKNRYEREIEENEEEVKRIKRKLKKEKKRLDEKDKEAEEFEKECVEILKEKEKEVQRLEKRLELHRRNERKRRNEKVKPLKQFKDEMISDSDSDSDSDEDFDFRGLKEVDGGKPAKKKVKKIFDPEFDDEFGTDSEEEF